MPRIQGRPRRKSQEALAAEVEARYEEIKVGSRAWWDPAFRRLPATRFLVHCSIDAAIKEWHPHAFDDCNWNEGEALRIETEEAVQSLNFRGFETTTFLGHRTFFVTFSDAVFHAKLVYVELLAMLLKGNNNMRLAEHCEDQIQTILSVPELDDGATQRAADAHGGDEGRPPTDVVVFQEEIPLEVDVVGCGYANMAICTLQVTVKSFTIANESELGLDRVQCIECGTFEDKATSLQTGWEDDGFLCPPCLERSDDHLKYTVSSINEFGLREYKTKTEPGILAEHERISALSSARSV